MADRQSKYYVSNNSGTTCESSVPRVFATTCNTCECDGEGGSISAVTWNSSTLLLTIFQADGTSFPETLTHTHAFGTLSDVDLTGVTTNQVLQKSATDWVPVTLATVAFTGSFNDLINPPTYALGDLTDVTTTLATTNQVLAKSAGDWQPLTLGAVALSNSYTDLSNKPFGTPADQEVVYYNATTSLYETLGKPFAFSGKVLAYSALGALEWIDVSSTPGGVENSVQYNVSGAFAGTASFTYNGTNVVFSGGFFQIGNLQGEVNTIKSTTGDINLTSAANLAVTATTTSFSGAITAASLGADTDDTVLILNSLGSVKTREIDTRVWGSTLVDGAGTANTIAMWSDANTLTNSVITYAGGTITADVTSGTGFIVKNNDLASTALSVTSDADGTPAVMALNASAGVSNSLTNTFAGIGYGLVYFTTTELGFYNGSATAGNRLARFNFSSSVFEVENTVALIDAPPAGTTSNLLLTRDGTSGNIESLAISSLNIPDASDYIINSGNTGSNARIECKIITIGEWNMNVAVGGTSTKTVAHGIASGATNIRAVIVTILPDSDAPLSPTQLWGASVAAGSVGDGGAALWNDTNVVLTYGAAFDSNSYNETTGFNRGFITIIHESLAT